MSLKNTAIHNNLKVKMHYFKSMEEGKKTDNIIKYKWIKVLRLHVDKSLVEGMA